MRRHSLIFILDLGWVALSAVLAVLIRDNFILYPSHVRAALAYALIVVAISALVFAASGTHKILWRYTSLPDVLRIMAAVTLALLLGLFVSFILNRTEGVARSVPLIQWFLLGSAMIATRVGARIWDERRKRAPISHDREVAAEPVLIVGVSRITELFLQSVSEYAANSVEVVGILADDRDLQGRVLREQKVLGTPEELMKVMAQLEVHGIAVQRIVVTQPLERLSPRAAEILLEIERASDVRIDWLVELMRLGGSGRAAATDAPQAFPIRNERPRPILERQRTASLGRYGARRWKRAFDIICAVVLVILLLPVLLITGLLVAADVGFPLVFWQKRPGRNGRPFKLFKFRTMRPAHDATGLRIPDDQRSSKVGRLLRRMRLDELPQLYNIMIGEMSFVGPRPLLPADQPVETQLRLAVRPGLTGLAQVCGERDMAPEDKNALDVWYAQNASLWLDIKILLRTVLVVLRGERIENDILHIARAELLRSSTREERAA